MLFRLAYLIKMKIYNLNLLQLFRIKSKILETIFCKNASTENDVILDATGRDFISKSGLRTLNQTAIL